MGSMITRVFAVIALVVLAAPLLLAAPAGEPIQDDVLHFSGSLMFWKYVAFGLIVLVLGKFVIPIMLNQLNKRQDRIQDALDKADQVRAEAEVLLKRHEEMVRNAHQDAKKITDDALAAAREVAARITAEAETAANEIRNRSQREIELMQRKAESELRETAVELALLAGSRVLERSLNEEDHRRLAREAIEAAGTMRN
jgi:F-type H+-transporting ATPase subunit b